MSRVAKGKSVTTLEASFPPRLRLDSWQSTLMQGRNRALPLRDDATHFWCRDIFSGHSRKTRAPWLTGKQRIKGKSYYL